MGHDLDIVLVGGGLQSALIALAVLAHRPEPRIAIVEAGAAFGGNHTWCFHGEAPPFVDPLIVARWSSWEVRFPELSRTFDTAYASVSSSRLHHVLCASGVRCFLGRRAVSLDAHEVVLDDGTAVRGELVVDARGPREMFGPCAWQKFVGLEVELERPCAIERPLVMDAEVEQRDGFRFLYVLPFAERRLLLEDTYFSLDPTLDDRDIEARIFEYATSRGLEIARVLRRERGILPLPLTWSQKMPAHGPLVAGYGGGFFHPTTGYSFPIAVRLAELIARSPSLFDGTLQRFVDDHARQARYAVMLNRLLFGATAEGNRRDVLERFHRLPEHAIERFYALQTTSGDRLRILCGRPPRGVSLLQALEQVVFA